MHVPKYDATFAYASGAAKPVATLWLHYGNSASASSIGRLPEAQKIVQTPYYFDAYSHEPRYYQRIAIDRTVEAVAKGQKRILLVMATGTGKTSHFFPNHSSPDQIWCDEARKISIYAKLLVYLQQSCMTGV